MDAFEAITPDTHAKYLLTSGSTGHPKVVINTHRMLCANQQMIAQVWRFLEHEKPVLVDWLPWSHTFGGNHNLQHGAAQRRHAGHRRRPAGAGADRAQRGQPVRGAADGLFQRAARLRHGAALAGGRPARWRGACSSGCAWCSMPAPRCRRPPGSACRRWPGSVRGEEIWLTTSWGSTETSPAITSAHWKLDRAGIIGLPMPGLELKFVRRRRQAGDARARRQRLPRLPRRAAAHRAGLRCRGLLLHRRRRLPGRRGAARERAWSSTAASPRTSSSPPAPGCRWARCACAWSRRWRPRRRTWWSPATTATRSACWSSPRRRPRRCRPTNCARRWPPR